VISSLTIIFRWFVTVVNKIAESGEEHLSGVHTSVQKLADDTAVALKKNVYKNYSQFIETAKEISSECLIFVAYMFELVMFLHVFIQATTATPIDDLGQVECIQRRIK